MANTMTKIASYTVPSGGVSFYTFSSIPSIYTDLKISISIRGTASTSQALAAYANGVGGTSYSETILYGTGSGVGSGRYSNNSAWILGVVGGTNDTSNVFNSIEAYIPNYAGSNYKTLISDSVEENNGSAAYQYSVANLFASTSAITSLTFYLNSGIFAQYSEFTLYGI